MAFFMRCTNISCESSSVGRARPCQGRGREFESRLSLYLPFRRFFFAKGIKSVFREVYRQVALIQSLSKIYIKNRFLISGFTITNI